MRQREVTAKLSERTMRAQSELEGYPADEDQGDLDRRLDRVLDRVLDLHIDLRRDPAWTPAWSAAGSRPCSS